MIRERKYFLKEFLLCLRLAILILALVLLTPITTETAQASSNGSSKTTGKVVEFHVKKIKYRVTKAATKKAKGTVTVLGVQAGYNPKTLTIPSTVTYRDYKYTVNEVGDDETWLAADYLWQYLYLDEGSKLAEEYVDLIPEIEWGSNLSSVTLPSTIKIINCFAFGQCEKLKEISIPESVIAIGSYAFYGCTALKKVAIPSKVEEIYISTFEECTSLIEIKLPKNLKTIGDSAFRNCNKLKAVSIPATTTLIGYCAFDLCNSLTSFKVAPTNKTYKSMENALFSKDGKTLLSYPRAVGDITIPNGVTTIESCAIQNPLLSSLTIPDSVTTIDDFAFYFCTGLKEVNMGDSVEIIGLKAFYECTSLESITMPSSLRAIGISAFSHNSSLKEVILNDSLEYIEDGAFEGCTSLETFTIPASVREVADNIFGDCPKLKDIRVEIGNLVYKVENGMLLSADGTTLVGYPTASGDVTIPATIKYIGNYAFQGAPLKAVVIPETVLQVGKGAFIDCTSLNSVRFMSRNTDISFSGSRWDSTGRSVDMFSNTPDTLVITIPMDPLNDEPIAEEYASQEDYYEAYYKYLFNVDIFAENLMDYSHQNATIVYQ